jgi:coenzyme F420-0:L-glutamate ligase / coenzyme F420-1:gamma-L-glutamate ligase
MMLTIVPVAWPRVRPGDDLTDLLLSDPPLADGSRLADGDIVVLTSKVVSKAEARYADDRKAAIAAETRRVVARRGQLVISETRHGHVQANAGVDTSNMEPGGALLLPLDPDATARRLRSNVWTRTDMNVAIVITDTMGRAWRTGHVDQAIGCAGLAPVIDLRGVLDPYGNELRVTMPAVADELAATADLVKAKITEQPIAIVRGLGDLVLPPSDDGPGAAALVRSKDQDLFGWGAREAVVAALRRDADDVCHFGSPGPGDLEHAVELAVDIVSIGVQVTRSDGAIEVTAREPSGLFDCGRVVERLVAVLAAHRSDPTVQQVGPTTWQVAYTSGEPAPVTDQA